MREVVFLRQNRSKWKDFENHLDNPNETNPDKLADLFVQVTDDLSYARTFYPRSNSRAYLNNLAARVYLAIYKNKRESGKRFIEFWAADLPLMVYQLRYQILLSVAMFIVFCFIGVVTAANDEGFTRAFFGNQYVDATIENIEKGDPTGIYKDDNALQMFTRIVANNLAVMALTFVAGLLMATPIYILYNSIMLGVFFMLFYQHGVHTAAWLNIMIHGTMEISCMVLSGAAGMAVMRSVLMPNTYHRARSLRTGITQGLKLYMGLTPFIIIAAVLESFVTRYSDMSFTLNLFIVIGSAAVMVGYFGLYPFLLRRRQRAMVAKPE